MSDDFWMLVFRELPALGVTLAAVWAMARALGDSRRAVQETNRELLSALERLVSVVYEKCSGDSEG